MTKKLETPNMPLEKIAANRAGASQDARMQWFREARFGLFIHWDCIRSRWNLEK